MTPTRVQLSTAHYPVTVLGYGNRLGIWLQGCSIGCKGCISKDTWNADESKSIAVVELLTWAKATCGTEIDGVTISGGEPFDQPTALDTLLRGVREWFSDLDVHSPKERDLLCYSGYPLKVLQRDHADILSQLDVVIAEPFVVGRPIGYLRGSDNQRLTLLTDVGRRRYATQTGEHQTNKLQAFVDADFRLWLVGIPGRDALPSMALELESQGLSIGSLT